MTVLMLSSLCDIIIYIFYDQVYLNVIKVQTQNQLIIQQPSGYLKGRSDIQRIQKAVAVPTLKLLEVLK